MTDASFYEGLPKKRMAAGALFLDEKGRILVVRPTYKQNWEIPGGTIEEDESPRQACIREVKEELGLDTSIGQLLCVDYTTRTDRKSESLQFVFYGGVLTQTQIQGLALSASELAEYKFLPLEQALPLVSKGLASRLTRCLQALKDSTAAYLEDGQTADRK